MGRGRSGQATAGVTIGGLRAAVCIRLGGGGADDPPRGVARGGLHAAARARMAVDGLDNPPRAVTDHFPTILRRGKSGEG